MKRNVGILTGVAALGAMALGQVSAHAQVPPQQPIQQTTATMPANAPVAMQQPLRTRVAMVNLAHVVKNYQKFQNLQREFEETYKTFDKQLESKRQLLVQYQAEAQKVQADTAAREQWERKMRDLQREMQDMGEEAKKQLSKKQGDQVVIIYKEIEEAVQVYARSKDIELVLHYNDMQPSDLYSPMNVSRKLGLGAAFPIYAAPGMDITNDITTMLNTRYQRMMQAAGAAAAPTQPQR